MVFPTVLSTMLGKILFFLLFSRFLLLYLKFIFYEKI